MYLDQPCHADTADFLCAFVRGDRLRLLIYMTMLIKCSEITLD